MMFIPVHGRRLRCGLAWEILKWGFNFSFDDVHTVGVADSRLPWVWQILDYRGSNSSCCA
jgi:hypothetical protein